MADRITMTEMGIELGPFTIRREKGGWTSVAYRLSDNHLKNANKKHRAAAEQASELLRLHEANDILQMFPRITYFHPEHFLQAKYGELTTIVLEGFGCETPTSDEEVQSILEDLPDGFIRNPDYGLGLVKECRPIIDRIRSIGSITTLLISKRRESSIDNETFVLDYRTFSAVRKAIHRTHLDALATAKTDKHILAHNALLSGIDPQKYPLIKRPYKKDVIFKTVTGTETTRLSARDEDAVVDVVKAVGRTIVKTNPEKMLGLKRDVDLLTLEALITKLIDMLAQNHNENRWHALFKQNPFIPTLAFGIPIIILDDQVSVGGQTFSGVGNKIADFLHRSPQTDNITLIEIKTPKTKLLGTEYRRKVFSPASGLLGAVNQVLDQRYQLQKQLAQLKDNSGVTNLESYAIKCILIAGITPEGRDAKKSWELFRNNLNDVLIVTFDELLQKLRFVHDFLKS